MLMLYAVFLQHLDTLARHCVLFLLDGCESGLRQAD